MKQSQIYIDGVWKDRSQACVSVFDHGFLYGDGVFEGIRAYHRHVFRLNQHLDRLYASAKKIDLTIPMEQKELANLVQESIGRNDLTDSYIRLLVTRGVGDLGLDTKVCVKPNVIIIAEKLALYPAIFYKEGLSAIISSVRRNITEALDPSIKSMNYLNMILAKIEASKKGVPEAIMLNHQGYVSECSGDNVFFIHKNKIFTPPISAGVLVGITRGAVIEIIKSKTQYSLEEKLFKPDELMAADEVFFTGTAAEVIPVTTIDNKPVGQGRPGIITQELMHLFHELTKREAQN